MMRHKMIRLSLLCLMGLLCMVNKGWAINVNSADALQEALGGSSYASVSGNTVTLLNNVELSETINITGGEIVLDLAQKTISLHLYNKKVETIIVSGGNVIIKGNGIIKAHSQYRFGGVRAFDAISLAYNGGSVSIYNATFEANPFYRAIAYTLDPNNNYTVNDMIPYGAYILNANASDYKSTGYPGTGDATATTKVYLSKYTPLYSVPNDVSIIGGTTHCYTIEDTFTYPTVSQRKGYEFTGWTSSTVEVNKVPVTKNRKAEETINFTANWKANEYKIKYAGIDTEKEESYTIEDGTITLSTPTNKLGYKFLRWVDESGSEVKTITYDNVAKDTNGTYTVTAQWEPVSYTVTLKDGNSTLNTGSYTIENTGLSELLSGLTPTKRGYKFEGWYYDAACNTAVTTDKNTTNYPSDKTAITWYAKWSEPLTYKVSYDWSGSTTGNLPTTYTVESNVTLGSAVSSGEDGFGGWKDKTTGKMVSELPPANFEVLADLQLMPIWDIAYTITFDVNAEDVDKIGDIETKVSQKVKLPGVSNNKKGYTFVGWKNGDEVYQANQKVQFDGSLFTNRIVPLTAVWQVETYKVEFKDGTEVKSSNTYTIETGLSGFPTIDKTGYIFNGWKYNDELITSIAKGEIGDRELQADWTTIEYRLTYDYNDNKTDKKTVTYTYEQSSTKELEDATRDGYKFLGWKLPNTSSYLTKVPVDETTKKTPIEFTAIADWEVTQYPVDFKLNDGTDASISQNNYTYTIEKGITDMPTASRTGYTFVGWYENAEGTGEAWTSVPAGTGELTLYAKWTPNVYNITYNLQGGKEVALVPSTFKYNVGATLPTSDQMEKANYTFAGWTREESSTNYMTEVPANTYAEDLTFYAQWTPKAYTVKFETEGTAVTELPYVYGTTVSLKKTYRNGYTFAGWYSDKALTKEVGLELSPEKVPSGIGEDNTFTLYAKWTANTYTIEYDTYYGTIVSGKVSSYTTGEEVTLPTNVVRDGFSFAGWYADDLLTTKVEKIEAGEWGDKTFYASWTQGNQVIFSQPANGKITVTMNGKEISSGTLVGAGVSLTVTAVPTVANYTLKSLKIGDKSYTSSPQTVEMPASGGLVISATFADGRQAASAPIIYTYPSDTENVPWGEDVKVTLEKTDSETTLYYRLDDSPEKAYTGPFYVEAAQDTVVIYAIARKEGYADGISEQMITFDDQKVTLTFDLPNGVTAKNPYGEDLLTVIKTGGTFYFELEIDKNYYDTSRLDSMVVMANGKPIYCSYSGIYWLEDCTEDVTITISGLKAYTCVVTLQQTDNGTVSFTWNEGETSLVVPYGDRVSVTATPDEFYKFAQWNTGSRQNPMVLTIDRDTTLSAKFVEHYDSYWVVLPELEGATVKPFSGYTTEVKHNKEFKFYVSIASGYHEENLVVKANGEVLEKNKGGYAIYNITNHVSISVEGIVRDTMAVSLPEHVDAYVVETMEEAKKAAVYEETWLLLRAVAPEGKVFVKWTDGKLDNPRVVTALDAKQLIPLFEDKKEDCSAEVVVEQSVGAAITGLNMDLSTVNLKDTVEVKVIVLPAYSQSEVVLMANDKAVEAQTALRSTSEMKTYLYQFPIEEKKVTIRLEGLQRNRYKVSLGTVEGGTIEGVPTDSVAHGDTIRLVPTPLSGHLFMKWWNGQTLNPYAYVVTGDCTVEGEFIVATSPVANETVQKEGATIKVVGSTLYINTTFDTTFYVWDYRGVLLHTRRIAAGTSSQQLATGVYVVKVGEGEPKKIFVR